MKYWDPERGGFIAKYTLKLLRKSYGRDTYKVTKNYGDWCGDDELIRMCDKYSFGGIVSKNKDTTTVEVYTD